MEKIYQIAATAEQVKLQKVTMLYDQREKALDDEEQSGDWVVFEGTKAELLAKADILANGPYARPWSRKVAKVIIAELDLI